MDNTRPRIPILIISGSPRPGSFTAKAAAVVADELRKHPGVDAEIVYPGELHLPMPGSDPSSEGAKLLREKVAAAAAVVLATPEYHGSFSSLTKLTIENLGFPSALSGKPVALLGVAAGAIGAIKSLEHLRGVVSHIGGQALPLAASIPNVQSAFDAEGKLIDATAGKLLARFAESLINYLQQHICPRITLERILREGPAALELELAGR